MGEENQNQEGQNQEGQNQEGQNQEGQNQEGQNQEGQNIGKEQQVPFYKLKKANDKLKEVQTRLAEFEKKEKEALEKKLKEEKEFDVLLAQKDKEIQDRDNVIHSFKEKTKKDAIDKTILKEIKKHKANDPDDILLMINFSNLTVTYDEENNKVSVEGLETEIEKLKVNKSYLFGNVKTKNDTKENLENTKSTTGEEGITNNSTISVMGGGNTMGVLLDGLAKARKK